MPCHPARARQLLRDGKAAVYRRYPFTIVLQQRAGGETQPVRLKIDPGSRVTGLALTHEQNAEDEAVWACELEHRGSQVKRALYKRRILRHGRRGRKCRYRKPRLSNRRHGKLRFAFESEVEAERSGGWLPPSLRSRVQNVLTWVRRLQSVCPVTHISVELARFDTQAMQRPEIHGVEYQQGELAGYELREYLLEKWERTCAYCGKTNVPLQVEHIVPKARGGSNRASNLTLACEPCNMAKGKMTAEEYGHPEIQKHAKQPLRDAAAVNATRWALYRSLQECGLPVEVGTGGRTKWNRTHCGYPKAHWLDALCVGISGAAVAIAPGLSPLRVKAVGRGRRQMCRTDKYGFPNAKPKGPKIVRGFKTGDIVRATKASGKHEGVHVGRVAVRARGQFDVSGAISVSWRFCEVLHKADGYDYLVAD